MIVVSNTSPIINLASMLLGILIEAKDKAIIPSVKPVLDDLISKAGFWVSNELYNWVLRSAGE